MEETRTRIPSGGLVSQDETVSSLRRVCDRYFHEVGAGHVFERGHSLPRGLIRKIVSGLPNGIFDRVALPAGRANSHHLTVRVSPLFYSYVAATAEYCLGLAHENISCPCCKFNRAGS
jgi:hypothetical protein